jgi:hypothetical protein
MMNDTEDRYIILKHKVTGEEIIFNADKASRDRLAKGFLNKVRVKPYFLKHITLTQKHENYRPKILNNFFANMRKYYGESVYIWTVEVQEKRLEKYGEHVLHWHIIYAFNYDVEFGRDDIFRIQRYWKHGNVDIRPVRKPSMQYLMKYLTKTLEESFSNVRRIGSSRIEGYWRQGWKTLMIALLFFANAQMSMDDFYWYKGSAYLYEDHNFKRGRLYVYERKKEYEYFGERFGEPF